MDELDGQVKKNDSKEAGTIGKGEFFFFLAFLFIFLRLF